MVVVLRSSRHLGLAILVLFQVCRSLVYMRRAVLHRLEDLANATSAPISKKLFFLFVFSTRMSSPLDKTNHKRNRSDIGTSKKSPMDLFVFF